MGFFSRIFTPTGKSSSMYATDLNGDTTTSSGMVSDYSGSSNSVDEDSALSVAALHQGVNIISDTIASMPVFLYKEDEEGFQEIFPTDPRSRVLSNMANEVLTSFNLKKVLVKDMILHGNAFAKIKRDGEKITLEYIPTDQINVRKDNTGYYFEVKSFSTEVTGERFEAEIVDYYDMLVLIKNPKYNSILGTGLLEYAATVINTALEESTYMNNLFKNGLSAKAVLSSKTPFKKEVKEQLKSDLKSFYSGSSNAGKILVLEGDVNILPLSLTPSDIKLIENKHFTISELARFLNIPKHLLSLDKQQGTYSNISQEKLQLLTNTLTPYVTALEEAFNQKLLSEEEQNSGYYFKFDTSELLKLTPEDQSKYILELYNAKVITLEEVRASLNWGGDVGTLEELKKYKQNLENKIEIQSKENDTEQDKQEKESENLEKEVDSKEKKSSTKDDPGKK